MEKCGVQNWKMWSPKFRKTCTRVRNAATIWFIFHDFPGPRPNSMTFQAWKIWILNSTTFQDLYAPCTLENVIPTLSKTDLQHVVDGIMNAQHQCSDTYHVSRPRHRHQYDCCNVMYHHFNEILHNFNHKQGPFVNKVLSTAPRANSIIVMPEPKVTMWSKTFLQAEYPSCHPMNTIKAPKDDSVPDWEQHAAIMLQR